MLRSLLQLLGQMPAGVASSPPRRGADEATLLARLRALSPVAFEEWTADRLRELGYAVRRTGRSGDHGIDLVATRWGETAIVQCKRYTSGAVGEDVIGRLYGSMLDQRADRAYLVTSARVSAPARRWIGSKPIEIWDATGLLANWSGQISRLPDPKDRSPAPQGGPPTASASGRRRRQRARAAGRRAN